MAHCVIAVAYFFMSTNALRCLSFVVVEERTALLEENPTGVAALDAGGGNSTNADATAREQAAAHKAEQEQILEQARKEKAKADEEQREKEEQVQEEARRNCDRDECRHSAFEEAPSPLYVTPQLLGGLNCKGRNKAFVKAVADKTSQFKPSSSAPAWSCKMQCGTAYCNPCYVSTVMMLAASSSEGGERRTSRKRRATAMAD